MSTTLAKSVASKKISYIRGWPLFGSQLALRYDRLNFLQRLAQVGEVSGCYFGSALYLIASFESISMALIWTWYLLCQHPEIYQKVQQEIDTVQEGRTPTYEDLAHLPYCLQVFKEALRLYPPAPMIRREALNDIDIDGYHLSKKTTVIMSAYTLHRNPEYFPNPEQFDPERFAPGREKEIPRYAYIPFGAGLRHVSWQPFCHDGGAFTDSYTSSTPDF
jgi:hypothetical protein